MKERIRFKVYGNPQYTLNVLAKHSVRVLAPKIREDEISFFVYAKEEAKVKKLLKDYGRQYEISAVLGGAVNLKGLRKRYGFFVGALIGALLVTLYSTVISGVYVNGTEYVDEALIKEVVYSEVKIPSILTPVDLSEIENNIVKLDGVSYASVKRKGRVLCVEIIEELPKVDITDTQNPVPLKAKENGVITKIVVYGGSAVVAVGDEVSVGQELIMPYVKNAEGAIKPTMALGKVEARVTRTEEIVYDTEEAFNANSAKDMEERLVAFKNSLNEDEQFIGSRFLVKNVDKTIVCSIYYDILTRIT